jgi:alpha-tubulin suppressor-like RCC1 family protein
VDTITATTNSSTQITVGWTSSPDATSYTINYSINSDFTGASTVSGVTGTSKAITGLASGQQYYFRVSVIAGTAVSPPSSSASAITSLDAPSAPTVTASSPSTITTYSWSAVTCQAGATARYQYRYVINYTGGYTSVWYGPTAGLSATLDTSGGDYTYTAYTYTIQVQAQCYTAATTSPWSGAGQASYSRPIGWSRIAAGATNTCSITSDGRAFCWGLNDKGQLGNNSTATSLVPVAVYTGGVLSGKTVSAIAIAQGHACALASDNQAYCWGNDASGQLGNNSTATSLVPVAVYTGGVLSGKTVVSIANGADHTCALASDNQAYCWGNGGIGRLGNNSTTNSSVPVAVYTGGVLSGKTLVSIASGNTETCVIASDGLAYCWGYNTRGLGDSAGTTNSSVPVAVYTGGVLSGKTLVSIASGNTETCVIASDGLAYCWGYNTRGLGDSAGTTNSSVPVAVYTGGVLSGKTLVSIATSNLTVCAAASDGSAYCWGYNGGELGNNSTTDSSIPVAVYTGGVLSGKTVTAVSVSGSYACARSSDGIAYCWGYNGANGQLGNNSTVTSLVPVAVYTGGVLSGKTVTAISSSLGTGGGHTCILAAPSAKEAYCWGSNTNGELGNNSTASSLVPITTYPTP